MERKLCEVEGRLETTIACAACDDAIVRPEVLPPSDLYRSEMKLV